MSQNHSQKLPPAGSVGRERILQAATCLFAQRGFYGVSISDVAGAAGLVKSAIYHHFASKEELYRTVLVEGIRQSCAQMTAGASGPDWLTRLRGAALALGQLLAPQSHALGLILGGVAQRPEDVDVAMVDALRREFIAVFTREIDAGIAAGALQPVDSELAGLCLVGLIVSALQATTNTFDASRVDFALNLFLHGLAVPGSLSANQQVSKP